jgi:antitoxin (DNA-binding transcriptional repressor) of toxin-antitoxin stability system
MWRFAKPFGCWQVQITPRPTVTRSRKIAIDELRDRTDTVVAAVLAGERLTLTVDGEPAADIVPHAARRSPWVPSTELREALGDPSLLADVRDARGGLIDTD